MILSPEPVYTVAEVASALKLSTETVRRRITSGQLDAIEIGGHAVSHARRQYRIPSKSLVAWLGADAVRDVFGIGRGLQALQDAFAEVAPEARAALIDEAQRWARAQPTTARTAAERTATATEIAARFPKR